MTTSDNLSGASRVQMTRLPLRTLGALSLASLSLAACSKDTLDITNPNTPSVAGASADPQALQLLATGLLWRWLRHDPAFSSDTDSHSRP